jgi:uncharacterized protein YfiM (DUF2279 family)
VVGAGQEVARGRELHRRPGRRDIFKLDSDAQAFGVAMLPGIAKELLDAADTCNVFSTKDLAADALGAFIGVKVRGWIVTPRSVSYEVSF